MIKCIILFKEKGKINKSLLITQKDSVIENNDADTEKVILRFISETGKSYEELCSNKDIIVYNKKSNYERAKKIVKQCNKYTSLRSNYFVLMPFFQFFIQVITSFCRYNDTVFLDIQLYLLLSFVSLLNIILIGMNTCINRFHKKYNLGKNRLGNAFLALSIGLSLYSFINSCVPVKTLPYYLSIKSTNIEKTYENRDDQINKIFTDLENSPYLTESDAKTLQTLKEYISENPYISTNDIYKTFMTLQVVDKKYKGSESLGATYNPVTNTVDFYGSDNVSRENILQHEFTHSTGQLDNAILNEGYTSILTSRIANTSKRIDYYDKLRWCTEQVIDLVGEDIVLKAYTEENQSFLDQELKKHFNTSEHVKELYNLFMQYVNNDPQVDEETIKEYIKNHLNEDELEYLDYKRCIEENYEVKRNEELLLTK